MAYYKTPSIDTTPSINDSEYQLGNPLVLKDIKTPVFLVQQFLSVYKVNKCPIPHSKVLDDFTTFVNKSGFTLSYPQLNKIILEYVPFRWVITPNGLFLIP